MRFRERKNRHLVVVAGLIMVLGLTACGGHKDTIPEDNTDFNVAVEESTDDPYSLNNVEVKIPETEATIESVVETMEDGGQIGVSSDGETVYDFGKYGPLGKDMYNDIVEAWVTWSLETEEDLRIVMDATYDSLSNKEELTQDILAMTRNERPELQQTQTEEETRQIVQKTEQPAQETQEQKKTAQPKQETQVTVQETQASPQQQQSQPPAELPPEIQARVDANQSWQESGGVEVGGAPSNVTEWDYDKAMEGITIH